MNKIVILLVLIVAAIIVVPVILVEADGCPTDNPKCYITWPTRTLVGQVPPTPTAPMPGDLPWDDVVATKNAEYEIWLTAYASEPYPAPEATPEPEGYPDYNASIPFEETKEYYEAEKGSLATSLWAWILDLFTGK